ncbi:Uncharacterised protein [Mycobacteroides abscessus subsp. massiliense]|nr:Uncharacterised protein [Mycobacteroides abscessus subsp. massiliense]
MSGTGYQVCWAHERADDTEQISQNTLGSKPRRSASWEPSELAIMSMNNIMLLQILAATPAPPSPA